MEDPMKQRIVAQLTGVVATVKARATEPARQVASVREVINNLKIQ
jgi:osmotically-inducible protein OsmY